MRGAIQLDRVEVSVPEFLRSGLEWGTSDQPPGPGVLCFYKKANPDWLVLLGAGQTEFAFACAPSALVLTPQTQPGHQCLFVSIQTRRHVSLLFPEPRKTRFLAISPSLALVSR